MTTRLERGLRIYLLLQEGASYDAYQLAEKLGVTRRTVFRDIALLKEMGLPVAFDKELAAYTLSEFSGAGETPEETHVPDEHARLIEDASVPQNSPAVEQTQGHPGKLWLVDDASSLVIIGEAIRDRQTIRLRPGKIRLHPGKTDGGDSGESVVRSELSGPRGDAPEGITVLPVELCCTQSDWTLKYHLVASTSAASTELVVSESSEETYVVESLPHGGPPPPAKAATSTSRRSSNHTSRLT